MAFFEGNKMTGGYGDGPDIISSCTINVIKGEMSLVGPRPCLSNQIELIKKLGANVIGCTFIIDIPELGGRKKIEDNGIEVQALCSFEGH